jgi:hypothetical protein
VDVKECLVLGVENVIYKCPKIKRLGKYLDLSFGSRITMTSMACIANPLDLTL